MATAKKDKVIEVIEKRKFIATTETKFMSPNDLCEAINGLLAPVFNDYEGCSIQLNSQAAAGQATPGVPVYPSPDGVVSDVPMNAFYASIFFSDTKAEDGLIKNLKNLATSRTEGGETSLAKRFEAFSRMRANPHTFEVTQETLDALAPFMYTPPYTKELKKDFWNRHIVEYADASTNFMGVMGKPTIHVKITGINLNAIVEEVFGDKDENGSKVEYLIAPYMPPTMNGVSKDVIFQITRLNDKVLSDFMNGMYNSRFSYASSNFVRAR